MNVRRCVCGWCPMQLPDDAREWSLHFLIEHRMTGYSIRFYEAKSLEDEAAEL